MILFPGQESLHGAPPPAPQDPLALAILDPAHPLRCVLDVDSGPYDTGVWLGPAPIPLAPLPPRNDPHPHLHEDPWKRRWARIYGWRIIALLLWVRRATLTPLAMSSELEISVRGDDFIVRVQAGYRLYKSTSTRLVIPRNWLYADPLDVLREAVLSRRARLLAKPRKDVSLYEQLVAHHLHLTLLLGKNLHGDWELSAAAREVDFLALSGDVDAWIQSVLAMATGKERPRPFTFAGDPEP